MEVTLQTTHKTATMQVGVWKLQNAMHLKASPPKQQKNTKTTSVWFGEVKMGPPLNPTEQVLQFRRTCNLCGPGEGHWAKTKEQRKFVGRKGPQHAPLKEEPTGAMGKHHQSTPPAPPSCTNRSMLQSLPLPGQSHPTSLPAAPGAQCDSLRDGVLSSASASLVASTL